MKETLKMIGAMTVFCIAAGFLLAWVNGKTKAPIAAAHQHEMMIALKQVLPPHDNNIITDTMVFKENGKDWTFYIARQAGTYVGTASLSISDKGYGGPIEVLIGILSAGTIKNVEILRADKETPGLGAKIKDNAFLDQFTGRSATNASWSKVTKDGGQIQAITGATISSRAVAQEVQAALDVYAQHVGEITAAK